MEGLKQYLIELPKEELLRKQLSDVLVMGAHVAVYSGKEPAPLDDVKEVFYRVLKENAHVTHAVIYNSMKKTYLCSVGKTDLQWTNIEEEALHFRIDEVEEYRKFTDKAKILTRLKYRTHEEFNNNF